MPKTSVYLPDDLAGQVRAYGISISEVTQAALRRAVQEARVRENVMTDIQAVAERLQATRVAASEAKGAEAAEVRALGREWARRYATAAELEYVVGYDGVGAFEAPMSIVSVITAGQPRVPVHPSDPYWDDFLAGTREVWDAVQPLLSGLDEPGGTVLPAADDGPELAAPEFERWLQRQPRSDAPAKEHKRWSAERPQEFR